jgi:DNA-binding HxlR family transcriptional regulator
MPRRARIVGRSSVTGPHPTRIPRARPLTGTGPAVDGPGSFNAFVATCPTRRVLDIIADKWTVLIIGALSNGTRRFQQLRREVEGVTQKMLTQTLRRLERDGLVSRRIYATVPPRVEYSLTPLGHTITGPLWAVREWAETHVEEIEAARKEWDARLMRRGEDNEG